MKKIHKISGQEISIKMGGGGERPKIIAVEKGERRVNRRNTPTRYQNLLPISDVTFKLLDKQSHPKTDGKISFKQKF